MAYQYTDYSGYGNETEEETRRRRAMMLAGLPEGAGLGDIAGQALTNRVNQAQNAVTQAGQMFTNPEDELKKRMGMTQQPAGPVVPGPLETQTPVPQQLPSQGAISPAQAQQPVQMPQMPQPGPTQQVAGPAQMPQQAQPASLAQIAQQAEPAPGVKTPEQRYQEMIIAAGNETDPTKRRNMFAQVLANKDVSEGNKTLANRLIAEDYMKQKAISDAEQKIQEATPNDLSRYMKERNKEGSWVKALLYARLGLNDLAQKEQELLSPTLKMEVATDESGKQYTVERDKSGAIVRGFDPTGKTLGQEAIAKLSAGGLPTQAYLMPSVHGTPVQRTNEQGQVETGLMMYDPRTRQSYVQVGQTKQPTVGWTTMAQTPQSVYQAAGAQKQGGMAAETGVQQPALPSMAGQVQPQAQAVPQTAQPQTAPAQSVPQTAQPQTAPAQTRPQAAPAVTATSSATGGVKLTPQRTAGGGAVVTQQPGESYSAFQQRKEAAMKQTGANIELGKEVAAAQQKVPAEARGKLEAKEITNQNFANQTYDLIKPIANLIKESTGSGVGSKIDVLASQFGVGTKGQQAIAQLEPMVYPILMNIPRFEGAQSDADVKNYQRAAGDFANPEKPIATRLAALQGMITLLKKYDKEGKNDWSFSGGNQPGGEIRIIKREKVQ